MALPIRDINQLQKEKNQNYTKIVYTVSESIIYVCDAEVTGETISASSSVWRIKKIETVAGSPETVKISYANFDDRFIHVASSYNTYTYLA